MATTFRTWLEDRISQSLLLELAGLYLGPVEMPYRRQDLAARLYAFFADKDVQETLLSGLDEAGCLILSAIAFVKRVNPSLLASLVPSIPGRKRERLVESLTKRCLLISDEEGSYTLNDTIDYSSILSQDFLHGQVREHGLIIDLRSTIAAFVAAGLADGPFTSPRRRKAVLDGLEAKLPLLPPGGALPLATRFMDQLRKQGLSGNKEAVQTLLSASEDQLKVFLLGGGQDAALLAALASNFKDGYAKTLFKVLGHDLDNAAESRFDMVSFIFDSTRIEGDGTVLAVEADLSVAWDRLPAGSLLPYAVEVHRVDVMTSASLTKDRVIRAFDRGMSLEDLLSSLPGAPKGVIDRLRSWWDSTQLVKVYDGLYLEASPQAAQLIRSLPGMQDHILRRIGDDGFLMKRSSEAIWRGLLSGLGHEVLSTIAEKVTEEDHLLVLDEAMDPDRLPLARLPEERQHLDDGTRQVLSHLIDEKLTGVQKDAFQQLLEAGYIVSPTQVDPAHHVRTGRVVSGLDFNAKLSFLRSLCGTGRLVEVTCADGSSPYSVLALKTSGASSTVTLEDAEGGRQQTIPVSAIFKLREVIS